MKTHNNSKYSQVLHLTMFKSWWQLTFASVTGDRKHRKYTLFSPPVSENIMEENTNLTDEDKLLQKQRNEKKELQGSVCALDGK